MSEEVEKLKAALKRIAEPEAFYVATSHIDPEAYARMMFAEYILAGFEVESAVRMAEQSARDRYPLRARGVA